MSGGDSFHGEMLNVRSFAGMLQRNRADFPLGIHIDLRIFIQVPGFHDAFAFYRPRTVAPE